MAKINQINLLMVVDDDVRLNDRYRTLVSLKTNQQFKLQFNLPIIYYQFTYDYIDLIEPTSIIKTYLRSE